MALQMNDVGSQIIFWLIIIALAGSQKNYGKRILRQAFNYLMYPAGNAAANEGISALQQEGDISVLRLLLHRTSSARTVLPLSTGDKLREVLSPSLIASLRGSDGYERLFRHSRSAG